MIERLKALILGPGGGAEPAPLAAAEIEIAAAALLVEGAVMDGTFDADERRTVARLLHERFGLDHAAVEDLIAEAERAVERSSQLFAFTRVLNESFDADQRVRLIEMLWEVAYADGRLHDFEASLVRRVAGLIHVPDRASGAARKRVLARLGLGDGGT